MSITEFERVLRQDGFTDIENRRLAPHHETSPHAHDFEVRAMVLYGDITLITDGHPTLYGPGELFTMARGREHSEKVGTEGVTTISGRKVSA